MDVRHRKTQMMNIVSVETDRSSVWGDNPPAKQSLAPGGSSSSNLGSNELVLPYSTQSEQSAGSSGGESNELPKIDDTPASVIQAPTIGNNGINETRWYNNCFSGGEGRGSVLDFDTSSYETCGVMQMVIKRIMMGS